MWSIDNQTPFSAERTFVRDRDGSEVWLVAIRATFDLFPDGSLQPAKEQEPVSLAPQYTDKPGESSLRCDGDLPRTKLGTDVILNATAYAPNASPTTEVAVGLAVSGARKSLLVTGDTCWERSMGLSVPGTTKTFSNMPIKYERAFGGFATDLSSRELLRAAECNPVGVGIDRSEGAALPNVRYPGTKLDTPSGDFRVAGFGAIPCAWAPRKELAGTYDDKWKRERQPLVPDDFNYEYFYSAPIDQRVRNYLRGGEQVELWNLTPDAYLSFNLPKYSFGFRTFIDNGVENHRANLHTVLIEPDQHRLIMVWQTALPCHHTLYTLQRSVIYQKAELSTREREVAV